MGARRRYLLTKRPDEYTVGMILRITEGSMEPVPCLEERKRSLREEWKMHKRFLSGEES